jgi:hypothetical protein
MAEERPGQPIVTYFPTDPVVYHYRGPNVIARIPVDVSREGARRVMGVTDVGAMRAALAHSTPPDLVVWMVQRDNVPFGPADLEPYLHQALTVLERREYHGVRAWRLRLAEPVTP